MWEDFRQQSADWLEDPEIYSLHDLTRVNSGELFQILRKIVTAGMNHIVHCDVSIINIKLTLIQLTIFFTIKPKFFSYARLAVFYVKSAILQK